MIRVQINARDARRFFRRVGLSHVGIAETENVIRSGIEGSRQKYAIINEKIKSTAGLSAAFCGSSPAIPPGDGNLPRMVPVGADTPHDWALSCPGSSDWMNHGGVQPVQGGVCPHREKLSAVTTTDRGTSEMYIWRACLLVAKWKATTSTKNHTPERSEEWSV